MSLLFDKDGELREIRATEPIAVETVDIAPILEILAEPAMQAALRLSESLADHIGAGAIVWTAEGATPFGGFAGGDHDEPPQAVPGYYDPEAVL